MRSPGDVSSLADYRRLPFTTKEELSLDQARHPPYGTNLTYPSERYVRLHQTSGTTGRRLRWLDTQADWDWFTGCWMEVYRGAGVRTSDRIFFAFSFAPFIGFWTAFDAAVRMGAMAIPGGGMSSVQRLEALAANDATVLVCTPTYALHLAGVARDQGLDPAATAVRTTIHAGEPGSLAAGHAGAHRAGLGGALLRPRRCHRGRRLGLRVRAAGRPAPQRGRVPLRDPRAGHGPSLPTRASW